MSIPEAVPVEHSQRGKYERLIARTKGVPAAATLVVRACDEISLRGDAHATQAGFITPTLIGPSAKIARVADEFAIDIARFPVVIILTSYADSVRIRMTSCAVAFLYADARRQTAALQAP
jgi:hypothetical protein